MGAAASQPASGGERGWAKAAAIVTAGAMARFAPAIVAGMVGCKAVGRLIAGIIADVLAGVIAGLIPAIGGIVARVAVGMAVATAVGTPPPPIGSIIGGTTGGAAYPIAPVAAGAP